MAIGTPNKPAPSNSDKQTNTITKKGAKTLASNCQEGGEWPGEHRVFMKDEQPPSNKGLALQRTSGS